MAVPKITGIETELGIMVHGVIDWNPVAASSALINAYAASSPWPLTRQYSMVSWDFVGESPSNDAREPKPRERPVDPIIETHLVNTVLTNGARYYVDHAHPEISTPECTSALSVVLYDRAAELIAIDSMEAAVNPAHPERRTVLYKDNTDRKGNSYGCHENYLVSRVVPFPAIVDVATTHFVTRQVFTGSGKVGSELVGVDHRTVPYQVTQRAEHFEEEVGLETTLKRPIVNTRDEPHADPALYRRLHVIAGDANLAQVATLLKVGTTGLVLAMLEDGFLDDEPTIDDPVEAMHRVSHDLGLSLPLSLSNGRTATAVEIQWGLYARALAWAEERGLEAVGGEESGRLVLDRWQRVLTGLETDPMRVADQIDWVAKKRLLEGFMERHSCDWDDPRLRLLDLQYHDLRPEKSLAARVGLESLVSDDDARIATVEPPPETRAYFRGKCLQKYADSIVSANWDSIVFDVGEGALRRVPMMEPTRGTLDRVGIIIEESSTAAELVARLEA